jgi:hypothetical protein
VPVSVLVQFGFLTQSRLRRRHPWHLLQPG